MRSPQTSTARHSSTGNSSRWMKTRRRASARVTPIGPTWGPPPLLSRADQQGRDVAARLLYGGRNSLLIGTAAALITCLLATFVGIVAGFFGGIVDEFSHGSSTSCGRSPSTCSDQLSTVLIAARVSIRAIPPRIRQSPASDHDHRRRLHPVRRTPDSRRGALNASPRVRRGGDRPWRTNCACWSDILPTS